LEEFLPERESFDDPVEASMSWESPLPSLPPTYDDTVAKLLVCERAAHWAVALRRELRGIGGIQVEETRSLAECWRVLAAAPASFVVVEATPVNLEGLLRRLARRERQFPAAMVAVVAERRLSDHEWLLREAGAVHFACSTRGSRQLAVVALWHLARAPVVEKPLTEQLWARLPWAETLRAARSSSPGGPFSSLPTE
jgi:hypothetical protein